MRKMSKCTIDNANSIRYNFFDMEKFSKMGIK